MERFTHLQIPESLVLFPIALKYFILFLREQIKTTATSSNILTWMQSITDESRATISPLVMDIYKQQQTLRAASTITRNGCTFCYYQVHDAKLIYMLCQHAQWSRILKPFLLCKCNRGEGARNKNHVCSIVLDAEQLILYNKSEAKWNKNKSSPNYTEEVHQLWVVEKNYGISKQGIHPNLLP